MSRFDADRRALGRAAADLRASTPAAKRADGRTIPREGDEVFTHVPGPFQSQASIRGTVIRRRGALAVEVREGHGFLVGTQRLKRARVYPLWPSWTLRGETHPSEAVQQRAVAEAQEYRRGAEAKDAELRARVAASKAAGHQHLDEASPPPGTPVRSLRTGERGRVTEIHPRFGPLVRMDDDPPGQGGVTLGNAASRAEWVVV